MADNVAITAGTGVSIATDEVSGTLEHVQLFKLAISTDGSRTLIPADSTNGLLVDVSRVTGQVQIGDGTNAVNVDNAQGDGESNGVNSLHTSSRNYVYNGTTWDRVRGDITNGLDVDVTRVTGTVATGGNVAHDDPDSGNPLKLGAKAIAHGTNPTAVAASDRTDLYANRAGILFTIGGHPNTISRCVLITDANGPQTDASMVGTIASGTKVAVTAITVTADKANTADVAVKIGWGASVIPADSSTGVNGVLLDHPGIAAGSGVALGNGGGILGVGGDGEELRLTCEDPVGGSIAITFSYFTIES